MEVEVLLLVRLVRVRTHLSSSSSNQNIDRRSSVARNHHHKCTFDSAFRAKHLVCPRHHHERAWQKRASLQQRFGEGGASPSRKLAAPNFEEYSDEIHNSCSYIHTAVTILSVDDSLFAFLLYQQPAAAGLEQFAGEVTRRRVRMLPTRVACVST
jgi:hypothetical protein